MTNNRARASAVGPTPVPAEHEGLCQAALATFSEGRYASAIPPLARLVLALPLGHSLRPVACGMLARAYLAVRNFAAAQRELDRAIEADPMNATFRELNELLHRAAEEAAR